jgi:TetR/AcrR family transcriptional regulator
MTNPSVSEPSWAERAADRSPAAKRSRERAVNQTRAMLDAARRLAVLSGEDFTTQELAREAGVAQQTFYRYFTSKDELLLALSGQLLCAACRRWRLATQDLDDPLRRLHFFIDAVMDTLLEEGEPAALARFLASSRWRLLRVLPDELAAVEAPFIELLEEPISAAMREGRIPVGDSRTAAWLVAQLIQSVYHECAYTAPDSDRVRSVQVQLWTFCLNALRPNPIGADGAR